MLEYWSNKKNIEILQTNEVRGHFANATKDADLVIDSDIIINPIFNFPNFQNLESVYILIGKFLSDVCEHVFGELHTHTGINKQTARAINNSAQILLCTNIQDGKLKFINHFSCNFKILTIYLERCCT